MFTKALSLFAFAGLLVLSGCHNKCCNDNDRDHNDYAPGHSTYSPNNGSGQMMHSQNNDMPRPAYSENASDGRGSMRANYYDNSANMYAEGTVSTVDADGRITMSGYDSPYANSYSTYQRVYYSFPEAQRESRSREMHERYKDKLTYSENKDKARDFNFNVSTPEKFTVSDESGRYGRSSDTWTNSSRRTSRYNEIKTGDRVVVGYDSKNPGSARSIYRVDAPKKN